MQVVPNKMKIKDSARTLVTSDLHYQDNVQIKMKLQVVPASRRIHEALRHRNEGSLNQTQLSDSRLWPDRISDPDRTFLVGIRSIMVSHLAIKIQIEGLVQNTSSGV